LVLPPGKEKGPALDVRVPGLMDLAIFSLTPKITPQFIEVQPYDPNYSEGG
jgi:hypothetical protein